MHTLLDRVIRFFRFRPLARHVPQPPGSLLDLGCGPVPWFLVADPRLCAGAVITAIDRRPYRFGPDAGFRFIQQAVVERLPFADASFDCVTMLALIEHLAYPEAVVGEIHRVLKPGGALLLTTPSRMARPVLEFLAFRLHLIDGEEIADHRQYFSRRTLGALLARQGFSVPVLTHFEFGFNVFAKAVKG